MDPQEYPSSEHLHNHCRLVGEEDLLGSGREFQQARV